ncbi:MAG: VCBS domain-containing protein [Endozoicomonas sp. (ex Botrylloides leachii)]|nr:VCBS domain-containing protein [Endozoicomonas sp. (ex Botrylloides leachii)]
MNPDLDNLITVDAKIQQSPEHGSVDLLYPFISTLTNAAQVSRLKLKEGNEAGVSLSIEGSHLTFDFSAYSAIKPDDKETLRYEYRINDAHGRYSQTSALITLSLDPYGRPRISTATLTTNEPFDYPSSTHENSNDTSPKHSELSSEKDKSIIFNAPNDEANDDNNSITSASTPEDSNQPALATDKQGSTNIQEHHNNAPVSGDGDDLDSERDERIMTFHFTPQLEKEESSDKLIKENAAPDTVNYEALPSELPSTEEDDTTPDINLDQIIHEVDHAISEADRLMDSTFGNHDNEKAPLTELELLDNESPEQALTDLIDSLPEDEENTDHQPEESLQHLIECLPETSDDSTIDKADNQPTGDTLLTPNKLTAKPHCLFKQQMIIAGTSKYTFDLIDFDPNRLGLNKIRIDDLPENGVLLYNKKPIVKGQEVNTMALLTGRLIFSPDSATETLENISFNYSACFGSQSFESVTSSNLTVLIDISVNTKDSLVGSGDVSIADSKNPVPDFIAGTISGSYGELIINHNGYWVYEADRNQTALKQLISGSKLLETFTIDSINQVSYTLTFYIVGPYEAAKLVLAS